jgi:hypothetical protein
MLGMQNWLILLLYLISNQEMHRHSNDTNDQTVSDQLQQAATQLSRGDACIRSQYNTQQQDISQRNAIRFSTVQYNTAQFNLKLFDPINRKTTSIVLSGPHQCNLA